MRAFYSDGLSYREVYKLNIGKGNFKHYFVNPKIGEEISEKRPRISIRWCTHPRIAAHFWERWWMVFDHPPHANHEVPMYFLRNLWAEFELGLKPNYFDMKAFQGVGRGMPQDRPGAKLSDRTRNLRRAQPLVPLPAPVVPVPHHHRAVSSAITHLSALSGNLVQQWTQATHAPPLGHVCTSCGDICTGPQSDPDAAHDDHYAEGADCDDDLYAAHGDGSDEIDVSSFVDLM